MATLAFILALMTAALFVAWVVDYAKYQRHFINRAHYYRSRMNCPAVEYALLVAVEAFLEQFDLYTPEELMAFAA